MRAGPPPPVRTQVARLAEGQFLEGATNLCVFGNHDPNEQLIDIFRTIATGLAGREPALRRPVIAHRPSGA